MYYRRASQSQVRTTMPNVFLGQVSKVNAKVQQAQALLEEAQQLAGDMFVFSQFRESVKTGIIMAINDNIEAVHKTVTMINKIEDNVDRLK